jgi:alpha-1,2-glucosyltransferase
MMRTSWLVPVLIAAFGLLAIVLMMALLPGQPLVDEHFHLAQIQRLINGEFVMVPELPMPPGYHLSVATPAALLGIDNLTGLRVISAMLGLSTLMLAWWHLYIHAASMPLLRTMQLLLCPLLWPFFFLLYTDLWSLAVILAGLLAFSAGRLGVAASIAVVALAFRQTNVFWALLLWLMALHQTGYWQHLTEVLRNRPQDWLGQLFLATRHALSQTWLLLIPLVVFLIFVVVNQGVAIGDRVSHQVGGLFPSQIFFMLLVVWFVLLPVHVFRLKAIAGLCRAKPWIILILLAVFAIYMFSFQITHHYNFGLPEFHLRNRVLGWLNDSLAWRAMAFIGMAWALLSIMTIRLTHPAGYWLYPVTILALLPLELIEQRYYIVPFVFWMLLREPERSFAEWLTLAWFAVISTLLTAAIISLRYFL